MGEEGSGKSAFMTRLVSNKFIESYSSEIGIVAKHCVTIDYAKRLGLLDLANQAQNIDRNRNNLLTINGSSTLSSKSTSNFDSPIHSKLNQMNYTNSKLDLHNHQQNNRERKMSFFSKFDSKRFTYKQKKSSKNGHVGLGLSQAAFNVDPSLLGSPEKTGTPLSRNDSNRSVKSMKPLTRNGFGSFKGGNISNHSPFFNQSLDIHDVPMENLQNLTQDFYFEILDYPSSFLKRDGFYAEVINWADAYIWVIPIDKFLHPEKIYMLEIEQFIFLHKETFKNRTTDSDSVNSKRRPLLSVVGSKLDILSEQKFAALGHCPEYSKIVNLDKAPFPNDLSDISEVVKARNTILKSPPGDSGEVGTSKDKIPLTSKLSSNSMNITGIFPIHDENCLSDGENCLREKEKKRHKISKNFNKLTKSTKALNNNQNNLMKENCQISGQYHVSAIEHSQKLLENILITLLEDYRVREEKFYKAKEGLFSSSTKNRKKSSAKRQNAFARSGLDKSKGQVIYLESNAFKARDQDKIERTK